MLREVPREVFFRGQLMSPQKGKPIQCTILVDAIDQDPFDWSILYLSEKARNSLGIKLYLLAEHSEAFSLVYRNPNVQIWRINYPPNIVGDRKFLKTEFLSSELAKSWYYAEPPWRRKGGGNP